MSQVQKLSGAVMLFSILLAAMISVGEISEGSIGALLFAPYKRRKILLSKVIVVHIYTLASLLFIIIFSVLMGILFFGADELRYDTLIGIDGKVVSINQFLMLLLRLGLSLPGIIAAISLTFLLSFLTKNPVVTSILAVFLSFLAEPTSQFAIPKDSILNKLWLYSNVTIYGGIDYLCIITTAAMLAPLLVVSAYTAVFYFSGYQMFTRLDINT